ncbi:MAG: ParB/RepB/Spo0J family partition protein [Bacteroidota bacterium]
MASTPQKKVLGRGLDVLLSAQDQEILQSAVREGVVAVDAIDVNPFQPRDQFDPEALEELKNSIQKLGIIQPLTLRRNGSRYQLISGERRLRAARLLKMKEVPAYVIETDQQGMIEMALVENLQRKDLNPVEIGLALLRLQEECRLNQDEVAQRVGMSRANVSHYTRLVKLPPEIQSALRSGQLEMGHGKVLAGIGVVDRQLDAMRRCLDAGWSVRALEAYAHSLQRLAPPSVSKDKATSSGVANNQASAYQAVQNRLVRHFESPVRLQSTLSGKGEIRIPFSGTEDLNRLLDLIFERD